MKVGDKKINVMVTGVGGCGVGEGIVKALKMQNCYNIYATDCDPYAPTLYLVRKGFLVPRAQNLHYIATLKTLCKKYTIDVLIPGSDRETRVLTNYKNKIGKVLVLVNEPRIVKTASDGWLTYQFLKKHNFNYVPTCLPKGRYRFIEKQGFPLIIKPRFSAGSHDIFIAENLKELEVFLYIHRKKRIESIIQKYIGAPNEEYTVGVIISQKGAIVSTIALRRTLLAGASFKMEVSTDDKLLILAQDIAKRIGARGPLNIQARKVKNEYFVFEINPRFSGTTPVRCGLGINEPHIVIQDSLFKKSIPLQKHKKNYMICRAFQEVYFYKREFTKLKLEKQIRGSGMIMNYL